MTKEVREGEGEGEGEGEEGKNQNGKMKWRGVPFSGGGFLFQSSRTNNDGKICQVLADSL